MTLSVSLPWPPQPLWPNRRAHWAAKAKAAAKARSDAAMLARAARLRRPSEGVISLCITFCPPDRRRRDMDGMLSASKPLLDGVADAMGADDARFRPTLVLGEVVKGGAVVITVEAAS